MSLLFICAASMEVRKSDGGCIQLKHPAVRRQASSHCTGLSSDELVLVAPLNDSFSGANLTVLRALALTSSLFSTSAGLTIFQGHTFFDALSRVYTLGLAGHKEKLASPRRYLIYSRERKSKEAKLRP